MTKIKTRLEAREASVAKWIEIQEKVLEARNLVDQNCGFCLLAKSKSVSKFRCPHCEPDVEKLCKEYITDGGLQSIMNPLAKASDLIVELKDKIVNLPDVYNEE